MAVPQEYEIIRDLDTVREAIIAENRGILLFFVNKYRQYLPREIYKTEHIPSSWVDQLSCCLVPQDISPNLVPLKSTGNGNCLFNSVSILLIGNESLHGVLRLLTAAEIFLHYIFYASHPR
jgi:hypothetical protein